MAKSIAYTRNDDETIAGKMKSGKLAGGYSSEVALRTKASERLLSIDTFDAANAVTVDLRHTQPAKAGSSATGAKTATPAVTHAYRRQASRREPDQSAKARLVPGIECDATKVYDILERFWRQAGVLSLERHLVTRGDPSYVYVVVPTTTHTS